MVVCEMCGKSGRLILADVEGSEMSVCQGCAKYGTIKKRNSPVSSSKDSYKRNFEKKVIEYTIVSNYASLIRAEREKRDMNQEDFSKFLNERESVVSKWEQGIMKPRIDMARKVEKQLGIRLVVRDEREEVKIEKQKKSDEFTLGDFIKVRKRR